jgi:D-sedoheptulose 7-phosphate isomerase
MYQIDAADVGSTATDYLADLRDALQRVPREPLAQTINVLLTARAAGKRVYVFGNGGSSATASHFVCDLMKTAQTTGFAPIRAFSLTDNTPLMTAWANDSAYDVTFARMVETMAEPGDVVIGISASGNSANVIEGFAAAKRVGATTVAFVGFDGGAALREAQIAIHVPCAHYGLAEDVHSALGHAITAAIRQTLRAERDRSVITMFDEASVHG